MIADDSWKVASTLNTDSFIGSPIGQGLQLGHGQRELGRTIAGVWGVFAVGQSHSDLVLFHLLFLHQGKLIPGKIWKMQTSCIKLFRIVWRRLHIEFANTLLLYAPHRSLPHDRNQNLRHVSTARCTQRFSPWMIFAAWSCGPRITNFETLFHAKLEIYIYTYNNILCITVLYLYHYIIKYCYYDILWFMMLNVITWYWRVITGHSNQ